MKTYEQLMIDLRNDVYAPVMVLYGEEPYYIDALVDYVTGHALDDMAREFDQMVLYGRDLPGADIAAAVAQARGFAMMGSRKVVIVREAQAVKKWDALNLYLDNPQPSSVLLIAIKAPKLDKRLTVWKDFEKKGGVLMASERLKDYQVARWISDYIARRNDELRREGDELTIDPRITQLLADSLGNDLQSIVGALRKLIDGRPAGTKKIDAALVERNIGISKDYNSFELQDALIKGDIVRANRIARYYGDSKDHPMVKELPTLFGFFSNLMMYHYFPDKANDKAVAAMLGINPFFVRDYAAAARRFNAAKTFNIIGYIRDTDARSKGFNNPSTKEGALWLELIYKILH